jgi:hypothetical protein
MDLDGYEAMFTGLLGEVKWRLGRGFLIHAFDMIPCVLKSY